MSLTCSGTPGDLQLSRFILVEEETNPWSLSVIYCGLSPSDETRSGRRTGLVTLIFLLTPLF